MLKRVKRMTNQEIYKELTDKFKLYFPDNSEDIRFFFGPGRVNLIGEHTDYNGGYVFPAALTLGTYMLISPREDKTFVLRSENFPGSEVVFTIDNIAYDKNDDWGNYPKGVINELKALNVNLTGANILYSGNIPNGAGLSSSASIGMVTGYALSQLAGQELSKKELAFICQRMENNFIGVNTGIMDQTAVGFGEKDHAILLNCKTYDIEMIPLNLEDYKIIITNTNKRRGLTDSKYNERRAECDKGLEILQNVVPNLECLGDLSLEKFKKVEETIEDPIIKARVRHVVTEDNRVLKATNYLKEDNLIEFGNLMKASHESLRNDYEVTGFELDALFDAQKNAPGCIGTRMTGAGFGGCSVSLVQASEIEKFEAEVAEIYEKQTGLKPTFYSCEVGQGVTELKGGLV